MGLASTLSWNQKLDVAIAVASALDYLHSWDPLVPYGALNPSKVRLAARDDAESSSQAPQRLKMDKWKDAWR